MASQTTFGAGSPLARVPTPDPPFGKGPAFVDPRDPRPEGTYRHPIFRDHNCWKCKDGALPCRSNYHGCEFPHARND